MVGHQVIGRPQPQVGKDRVGVFAGRHKIGHRQCKHVATERPEFKPVAGGKILKLPGLPQRDSCMIARNAGIQVESVTFRT